MDCAALSAFLIRRMGGGALVPLPGMHNYQAKAPPPIHKTRTTRGRRSPNRLLRIQTEPHCKPNKSYLDCAALSAFLIRRMGGGALVPLPGMHNYQAKAPPPIHKTRTTRGGAVQIGCSEFKLNHTASRTKVIWTAPPSRRSLFGEWVAALWFLCRGCTIARAKAPPPIHKTRTTRGRRSPNRLLRIQTEPHCKPNKSYLDCAALSAFLIRRMGGGALVPLPGMHNYQAKAPPPIHKTRTTRGGAVQIGCSEFKLNRTASRTKLFGLRRPLGVPYSANGWRRSGSFAGDAQLPSKSAATHSQDKNDERRRSPNRLLRIQTEPHCKPNKSYLDCAALSAFLIRRMGAGALVPLPGMHNYQAKAPPPIHKTRTTRAAQSK